MQSQEATLGGVLSIWTQPVDKCVAQSGDYSLGCRMFPAPSWTLGRTASTQPENAGLEQAQSLSSILFLNEKGCFQTAQCGYLNILGMKRNCSWRLLVVLKKHIMPYFTKYLSFSFFHSKLFSFGGCYDWNVQIPWVCFLLFSIHLDFLPQLLFPPEDFAEQISLHVPCFLSE